jgi:hypothetical protein
MSITNYSLKSHRPYILQLIIKLACLKILSITFFLINVINVELLISYSYHFYKIESLFSSHIILRIVFRKITGCTLSKLINTNLFNPNNFFAYIDFQTKFLSKINFKLLFHCSFTTLQS